MYRSPEGVPIAMAFAFMSSLYFRGKIGYAMHFAQPSPPIGDHGVYIIAPGFGLVPPDWRITPERMKVMSRTPVDVAQARLPQAARRACPRAREQTRARRAGRPPRQRRQRQVRRHPLARFPAPAALPRRVRGTRRHVARRTDAARRPRQSRARIHARSTRRGIAPAATEKSPRVGDAGLTAAQFAVVAAAKRLVIDPDATDLTLQFGAREVRLTNLRKLFWKNAEDHQARSAAVLRRHLAVPAAAPRRPRHGDEALPERRRGRFFLHEARAGAAAGVDRDLPDHAFGDGQLPDRAGSPLAPLAHQPRLHRSQPVVRALRRLQPPRLSSTSISIPVPAPISK